MDDDLPPLPPPLPPSHSRSFSSSSSSDAGSPRQPPFTGWSNAKSASSMRRSGSESSFTGRASATRRGARGGGHGKTASGTSSQGSNGGSNPSSPTLARAPGLSRTLSGASSSSSLSSASLSRLNSLSRTERASPARRTPPSSTLLSKPSPALSSSSRLSSPSAVGASTFSVGLGMRSPSSFVAHGGADRDGDHHLRAFAKGLGGLPSPPQTAAGSDGGSTVAENGGSGRYASATVRSNGTAVSGGSGGSGDSPTKPARPPKSEARRSASLIGLSSAAAATTPPRSQQVPAIGRTSPTVAGSPAAAPKRSEAVTSPRRRSELSLDLFDEEPPEDSGGADTSGSAAEGEGEGEGEETTPTKEGELVGAGGTRRRLRARTSSAGAEEVLDAGLMGEEAERRRERRARNAEMLREKNQRILDSINAQPSPSPSSSSLTSLSSPHNLRRSSTSSTIREIAAAQSSADSAWLENRPSSSARRRSSLDRTLRGTTGGVDEFGLTAGTGTVPRSRTLGDLARDGGDGGRSTPLRARTHGYRSGDRASLSLLHRSPSALDSHEDDPPRSMTALSIRRSVLVGSERTRTRAASAFGGTEGRDRAIEERFRRASREELLGGASGRERERRVSEPELGEAELPDSPTYARSASSLRTRAPLSLTNDLTSPSTRTPSRFSAHRPSLDLDHALERTGRSGSVEVLDSPSLYRTSSARERGERLTSPALSSLASPSTGFRDRLATASRVSSPLSTPDPSSSGSRTPADRDRERRRYSRSDGLPASPTTSSLPRREDELERTPRSGKKSSSGSGGSGTGGWRGVSEILEERAASRLSGEGGRRRNGFASPSSYASPPPPSSTSSRISDDLQAQRRRLESFEVGSEAWNAEFEALHRRARSRQSGSSNGIGADGRSSVDIASLVNGTSSSSGQSDRERDRTIRAINALLAGQGIVATAAPSALPTCLTTTSSTHSSPRKRQSFAGFDASSSSSSARPRRISFADGTNVDAPSAPGSSILGRPTGRAESRAESALSMRAQGEGEHHQLLLSAFERFQQHFSPSSSSSSAAAAQESADLVKRMHALLLSTTKLNTGLRTLTSSIQAAHVQAQLDEDDAAPPVTPAQFEKSVNALLRASDDQVRNLTEDLIAFTRVERERDRARREGELGGGTSRPVSRASAYSSSASTFSPGGLTGSALHSPPKRAATSSPYEGATVSLSLAAARSPQLAREVLRNPLAGVEEDDSPSSSSASRRHTLNHAARSPFSSAASPSPAGGAGRRGEGHVRSPLAEAYETPSRRGSARSGSEGGAIGLGLPMPSRSESRLQGRRGKTSDESTVRAVSPSHSHHSHPAPSGSIRFPTSTASAQLDSTPALPNSSPTRRSTIRASPSVNGTPTTFLGREVHTDAELAAWEALQLGANLDENDADLDARLPPPPTPVRSARDSLRSASPEVGFRDRFDHHHQQQQQQQQQNGTGGDSPGEGGRRKPRLSTGSLSSALKNALRPRRSTMEALNNGGVAYEPRGSFESASVASSSSPEMERERERRAERRREPENILRRTGSRS